MAKVRVEGKRTVPAYTWLRAVNWYAFQEASQAERARLNHLMTSMAFAAFTLEAYLNHVGALRVAFWPPLKRKLSPRDKLDVVSSVLGFRPDLGRRPWQSFHDIFKLRDLLVHAETETVPIEAEVDLETGHKVPVPLASWEQFMSMDIGERFLDDTEAMVRDLAQQAGLPPEEVFEKDTIEATTTPLPVEPELPSENEPGT